MTRNTMTFGLLLCLFASSAWADPCGMVPPIYPGEQIPISRVGLQQTYVFYKNGVETFVIRPGFTGKVDEFGMLIPFPTPPAIRKVPDHIFPHLAAAVDPPEVVVDLRFRFRRFSNSAVPASKADAQKDGGLKYNDVRVLKQEAVGMYEVAVLEAGSAEALKRWMDAHKYRYPEGMDQPCNDYVRLGWCFVAVKTKVGQKQGVDPRPGQRDVKSKLPPGSTFDGHVQAMGFRFKSDELVVPMRLSAFNKGELRNVVYLLTEGPRKIQHIPERYVVRQISGEQLYRNVTQPLPLRIIGGDEKDIPQYIRRTLPQRRNPVPKNGAARDLFASDLLAVHSGQLSLPHEELEKQLLAIGESLQLRGGEIDKVNAQALSEEREKTVKAGLEGLKKMTLTVVDGDFPRRLLAEQNLTFAKYEMPTKRNNPQSYDAKLNGPAPKKQGVLKVGAALPGDVNRGSALPWIVSGLAAVVVGLFFTIRYRNQVSTRTTAALLVGLSLMTPGDICLAADQADSKQSNIPIRRLLADLSQPEKASTAVEQIVARKDESKKLLMGEAIEGNDLVRRGWSIVALSRIGGDDVDKLLEGVHANHKQPLVIRTWAAAARVAMTDDAAALVEKANLVSTFPALGRPIGMRLIASLGDQDNPASTEDILAISLQIPKLQQSLAPAILSSGADKLAAVMSTAKDQNVRRQAAAYLGTLSAQGDDRAAKAVVMVYRFDPKAKQIPWNGGPLWVPGLRWNKENAQALVGNLIAWHLWCDRNNLGAEKKQIHNNLRSIALAAAAGYKSPGFREVGVKQWLLIWGKAVGRDEIEFLLKQQGVEDDAKYASVLNEL